MTLLNEDIFYFLHTLASQNEVLDFIIIFFAKYAQYFVLGISLVYIVRYARVHSPYIYKRYGYVLKAYLPLFLTWFTATIIKILTKIPRPFVSLQDVIPLFVYGGNDSFPSGHATVFSSLATVIYMRDKKKGIFFFILFILISLARVIAGIHYPIDILVGGIIGVSMTYIVIKRYGK